MKRAFNNLCDGGADIAAKKPRSSYDDDIGLDDTELADAVPCETEAAIQLITSDFPSAAVLGGAVPPLALKHQLYAIVHDRTLVDRQLVQLAQRGTIQVFQLTTGSDEYAVVFQSVFKRHVVDTCSGSNPRHVSELIDKLLSACGGEVTISKQVIKEKLQLSEKDITLLVSAGVLTMCNVNAWYIALPNASKFTSALTKGRQLVLRAFRSSRHKEILESELEKRHIAGVRLGMKFHIFDIKGGDYVSSMHTTSGDLLRLTADVCKKRPR